MTMKTLTLTDFLLARIAEDEAREVARRRAKFTEGFAGDMYVRAAVAHDRMTVVQMVRLAYAMRALGWGIASSPPISWLGFGWAARLHAEQYANHPDYDEAWRPMVRTTLRRLLCGHNSTEMWRESAELPNGIYATWTSRHVCKRCGKDML